MLAPPKSGFDHVLSWAVAAFTVFLVVQTLRTGEFKFPWPLWPMRRSEFPEGYWPLVAIFIAVAALVIWHALGV